MQNNAVNRKNMLTTFGENIDSNNVLQEYPRPQMVRKSYINLNGYWDYAIRKKGDALINYDGKILVPFSPESQLSGVGKQVLPEDILFYHRTFELDKNFFEGRVLIHCDAIDYVSTLIINDKEVITHKGGYLPYKFDITDYVKEGTNSIRFIVSDPQDTGYQSRGKQSLNPHGIWYTAQSGIWQTIWLESVPDTYIQKIVYTPDIDNSIINIQLITSTEYKKGIIEISYLGELVSTTKLKGEKEISIKIDNQQLWSPEHPNLYDIKITVDNDCVSSYFGMRKFSIIRTSDGYQRMALNNEPYFQSGLLDQGYWADGMLTPPSDEAMIYDIKLMKEMGFNMLRKHIKVEPQRWYYHCDRLGMLVWQDMVSGGSTYKFSTIGTIPFLGIRINDHKYKHFSRLEEDGRKEFLKEMEETIYLLKNVVSICMWVPFNEGWGQFDSLEVADTIRRLDPTRLIDHASGWHDQKGADFRSLHIYFKKVKMPKDSRPIILSEFGGYSQAIEHHYMNLNSVFGYKKFSNKKDLENAIQKLYKGQINPSIKKGLCATVYTQVSDVEDECNGLITYDRKVVKVDPSLMQSINDECYKVFKETINISK